MNTKPNSHKVSSIMELEFNSKIKLFTKVYSYVLVSFILAGSIVITCPQRVFFLSLVSGRNSLVNSIFGGICLNLSYTSDLPCCILKRECLFILFCTILFLCSWAAMLWQRNVQLFAMPIKPIKTDSEKESTMTY